ncbi:MAG TPA: hypothetical protein VII63_03210 [Caulobacteraceae bacterium]
MRSWFSRRLAPGPGAGALDAYKEGRLDERQRAEKSGETAGATRADVDAAYDRGRRDERSRRRGSPFLTFLLVVLAVAAAAMVFLAVRLGSFAAAGAVVDTVIRTPFHGAADKAGSALQNAGRSLKDRAGSGQN